MSGYENTTLWQTSLGKKIGEDIHAKERDYFRVNYEKLRAKAILLAGEINRTLPEYTVHDITHIDALWEMASLICGEGYVLNPAEAFVLGGAFLIHDLGMGLAAYPNGIDALKTTPLWTDTFSYLQKKNNEPNHEIEKQTLEIVLRSLHAKHAEELALASWGADERKEFLIDDINLREDYGVVIGKIAHSHWWDAGELPLKFRAKLGASGNMPNEWDVDVLKLSCIMRVADASHIDSRRAPDFLRKLRSLSFYSEQHWKFQQKLYQPRVENEKLIFTAKSPFKVDDSMSWWLCYDALKMIDRELYLVDSILHTNNRSRFRAKGVSSIENIQSISKLITPDGWLPVDSKIHVGNVTSLVKNLGGAQLYGQNPLVPLRELIQNGCDAIRARRLLEGEGCDFGRLIVRYDADDKGPYFEVEDNGVGMSSSVLTGPFLDFGQSFWGTQDMHHEFPGLETKSFSSTGKFGIGFFSVFMWGGEVVVTTRRYEESRSDTKVLIFEEGQIDRPLLRSANESEYIKDGGTRVRVYIIDESNIKSIFSSFYGRSFGNLSELLSYLFFTSDVSIYVEDKINSINKMVVSANAWKNMGKNDFVSAAINYEVRKGWGEEMEDDTYQIILEHSRNLSNIMMNGEVVGRGFLSVYDGNRYMVEPGNVGKISIGGYNTARIRGFVGCLIGRADKASRDVAIPLISSGEFKKWLQVQTELLKGQINEKCQVELASLIRCLKVDTGDLKFARGRDGYLNKNDIKILLNKFDRIYVARFVDYMIEDDSFGEHKLILNENVISVNYSSHNIFDEFYNWGDDDWKDNSDFSLRTAYGQLLEVVSEVWDIPLDDLIAWEYSDDNNKDSFVIGHVGNLDYYEKASVLDREKLKKEI